MNPDPPKEVAKCSCNHCSKNIEFEREHDGEQVVCPHCGMDTILFVPGGVAAGGSAPIAALPRTSRISTAKRLIPAAIALLIVLTLVAWRILRWIQTSQLKLAENISGFAGVCVFLVIFVFSLYLVILWLIFPLLVLRGFHRLEKVLLDIKHKLPP